MDALKLPALPDPLFLSAQKKKPEANYLKKLLLFAFKLYGISLNPVAVGCEP